MKCRRRGILLQDENALGVGVKLHRVIFKRVPKKLRPIEVIPEDIKGGGDAVASFFVTCCRQPRLSRMISGPNTTR